MLQLMESNNKLKEIGTENRTFCYFEGISNNNKFVLDNILLDEKSYENMLVHDSAYKTPYGAEPSVIFLIK